jgi:hypothetical protein
MNISLYTVDIPIELHLKRPFDVACAFVGPHKTNGCPRVMHHWHMTCIDGKAPLNCQRVNGSRADEWSISWAFLFQRVYNNSSCPLSDTTRTAHAEFCWRWLRRANTGSRNHQAERGHQAPQGTRGQRSPLRCQVLPPANFLCILQGLPLVSSRTWRYKYKYFSVETILLTSQLARSACAWRLCCVVLLLWLSSQSWMEDFTFKRQYNFRFALNAAEYENYSQLHKAEPFLRSL